VKSLAFLPLLALLFASCASDEPSPSAATPARKKMEERFGGGGRDPDSVTQDKSGKIVPNAKRSPYESKGAPSFADKDFKKQQYKAGDYAKKSWWGNKDYAPKAYAGNTDGSRFQTSSALDGKGAREAATNAKIPDNYDTDSYATNAAREAGNSPIKKSSNAEIDNRQKIFDQPEIIDWREQRSITMDRTKGILGP
jgi:hypothetical protein